jgi:hypothetical protein
VFLGTPPKSVPIQVTYVWLSDDAEPVSLTLSSTWYDSRHGKLHRRPEYRLYYPAKAEPIVYRSRAGDRLFLCQPKQGPLLALFCGRGSSIEQQLLWLFGLGTSDSTDISQVDLRETSGKQLSIAARHVLELIGVEVLATEDEWLERIREKFGDQFPPTGIFSDFARKLVADVDPLEDPDAALLAWMDFEERLFMTLERHIVSKRLEDGFVQNGRPDVEGFLRYSLRVQNRRKSRAGWAFGNHIEALLNVHGIRFKREATTEKRNGPDFLFPGQNEYHDPTFPDDRLMMLAAKTSCKDRWRQVLAEADRIAHKHLLTLEPGISSTQTAEMRRANLHLVIPRSLHVSFHEDQHRDLMSVHEFLVTVRSRCM